MVEWIEWPRVRAVVEYGPGLGAFTSAVLAAKPPGADYFAVELEPTFVTAMQQRFPSARIHHNSVANIRAICDQQGIAAVDAVISGLPWAAFPERLQIELMDATASVLAPQAQFVTFAYVQGVLLPAGQRFRKMLSRYFSDVTTSRIVWRNLPPAFVYRCRQ
jgi:phospholipid N-methyltransferase